MKISVLAIFLALGSTVFSMDTVFVNGVDTSNTLPTGFNPVDTNSYVSSVVTEVVDLDTSDVHIKDSGSDKFTFNSMNNGSVITFKLHRVSTSSTGEVNVELNNNTVKYFEFGELQNSPFNGSFDSTLTLGNNDKFEVTSSNGGQVYVDCKVTHNETTYDTLVVITVEKTTSVSDNFNSSVELTLFPNPVVNRLNFRFENTPFDVTVKILNMNGQVVREDVLFDNSIDVSDLKTGMYIVNMNIDGEYVSKIVFK